MLQFVEDPQRSVLCVGYIGQKRIRWFYSLRPLKKLMDFYRKRLGELYRNLSSEGYDTYVHMTWSRFDIIASEIRDENEQEMIAEYGLRFIYPMAVFLLCRPPIDNPSYFVYFDGVVVPQEDDPFLTTDEVVDAVLSQVSVVLYDNKDNHPFVQSVLDKAVSLGKRMIDINSNEG